MKQKNFWSLCDGLTKIRAVEIDLLKPACYLMQHQVNIKQLYALPTVYLCVFLFI